MALASLRVPTPLAKRCRFSVCVNAISQCRDFNNADSSAGPQAAALPREPAQRPAHATVADLAPVPVLGRARLSGARSNGAPERAHVSPASRWLCAS